MNPAPQVVVLVLAGGNASDALARAAGTTTKALVPIAGRPMIEHVVDALQASRTVTRTVVVGEPRLAEVINADSYVPTGATFAQSLGLGLGAALAVAPGLPILVSTADIPWLEAAAVDRFVGKAVELEAQLAYPIVPAEVAQAAFPEQKRTFATVRQGRFTGGNLLFIEPVLTAPLLALVDRLFSARKNPFALAAQVGPGTLFALLSRRASIPELERIASARLGGRARAVISEDAGLAADVDRPEQLALTGDLEGTTSGG